MPWSGEIVILAGRGPLYGTGHAVRMEELSKILISSAKLRPHVRLLYLESEEIPPDLMANWMGERGDFLFLLDARDVDPETLLKRGAVLALDNRCANRSRLERSGRILFYDTIPHPEVPLEVALRQALISPLFPAETESWRSRENRIFLYSGSLGDTPALDRYLRSLLEKGIVESVFRCGDTPPAADLLHGSSIPPHRFRFATRLDRETYRDVVAGSRYVAAHFGITILEAWYSGAIPILLSTGSELHERLSVELSRQALLPRLVLSGQEYRPIPGDLFSGSYHLPTRLQPTGEGYGLLREALFRFAERAQL